MASPYDVLGVDPDADRETVERRYRELVKEVHPDAGGSAEEFKRVKEAYREIKADDGAGASASSRNETKEKETYTRTTDRRESSQSDSQQRRYAGPSREERRRAQKPPTDAGDEAPPGGAGRSRQRSPPRTGSGTSRRWFLFGLSALLGAGALVQYDDAVTDAVTQTSGEPSTPQEDTVSREVAPEDLFDVDFTASADETVEFTVDGADTSDWVNVYTQAEYERVAENWDGSDEFDPGDPLQTVLTQDGYVCDLPEDGTYVILVKLWSGPPDDPREPREVEISYQIRS